MVNANKSNDLSLISRFKTGDISAFEEILLRHQDKIYNLCRRMLGNSHDAEDATQDVFLKAYQNINKFKPEASLYTWLFRIAVNTCIDYKREPFFESLFKSSKEGDVFVVDSPTGSPSPDRLYESKQISDAIQLTLSRLPVKLRAVIVLKEIEGLSYEEIAEVLDVSIGTVKSRISRARDDLKEVLKKFREQK
jgi:RNA polymerase sigma-70 factor (ECF subfamily)